MRPTLPAQPQGGERRPAPTSRLVLAAGALVSAGLLALTAVLFVQERDREVEQQLGLNAMHARVLADSVTTTVDTAALALASLAEAAAQQGLNGPMLRGDAMAQLLISLPQLRAIAVVDPAGRVLAASTAQDVGRQIDTQRLGPPPPAGRDIVGPFVPGRSLSDLAVDGPARAAPAGVGFLPLMRRARVAGTDLLFIGLLHPDGLANTMRLTVDDTSVAVTLASFDGMVRVSTADVPPGAALAALPVWQQFLPAREHGQYVGQGRQAGAQLVAFRVSRSRPLVVMVEHPLDEVQATWLKSALGRMSAAGVAVLLVALLSWGVARTLQAREVAARRLQAAQAEVARSERELSVIVRSVQELLFRTDTRGLLTFVNAHWVDATGRPAGEAIGHPFADFVVEDQGAAVQTLFASGSGRGARSATITLRGVAGAPRRRYEVAVVPLHDGERLAGFAGSGVDITAREDAQARLASELAFSALLQEMSPLPTSMLDTEGRYMRVNRAWVAFTGRRREAVIGQPAAMFLAPEEAQLHQSHDKQLLGGGTDRLRYEARSRGANGRVRDLLIDKVRVPGRDGRAQGILVTFMDVTELRDAARATQEARDAAEEASRTKSEFIANVSHELRTPLQSIIGFSELGAARAGAQPRMQAMFADILSSGQRMLGLVNDLLDVSKIESSVGTIHLERTDLRPLVREVARELTPLLDARRLRLDLHLPDEPLAAKVDPPRWQQVLRNVLANAIRFSPDGAPIVLTAALDDDDRPHVTVRDHGPGIPPKELETIFEAFVQSSRTKDGAGGTGLGLAICRTLIQAHGGFIRAENMPDGGSRFHIVLPARGSTETRPMPLDG